jgi:ubiquitin-conjugating enzyme E2 J1
MPPGRQTAGAASFLPFVPLCADAQRSEPSDDFDAHPVDDNLFDWHFVLRGPEDTPFAGGMYHGRIILPAQYPYKPPEFMFLCPTGRFEVGKKICLSISQHHPELWQPGWDIRTGEPPMLPAPRVFLRCGVLDFLGALAALTAIQSFMPTAGNGAIAALDYSDEERRRLADRSRDASTASLRAHGYARSQSCLKFRLA